MTPDINIRQATSDDALCIAVLGAQVFADTYATEGIRAGIAREILSLFSIDAIAKTLANPSVIVLVAEREKHLVGFVELDVTATHELVPPGKACEVARLYVQERFVGKGIGTLLLRAAEREGTNRGASFIWMTIWVYNARALQFYASRGYADVGSSIYSFEGERHENRVYARNLAADISDIPSRL